MFLGHSPEKIGLGLWNSPPATLVVEIATFLAGIRLYARATRPRDAVGRWAVWALVGLLFVVYLTAAVGPPPSSVTALASGAAAAGQFPLWAWWGDRHRETV